MTSVSTMFLTIVVLSLASFCVAQDNRATPGTVETCRTESGEDGQCVQFYFCNANNSVLTDGVGLLDIRSGTGPCDNYMDMCCVAEQKVDVPVTVRPPASTPTASGRAGCGLRLPNGLGFKIKGDKDNEAQFAEFPWTVAVIKSVPVPNSQKTQNQYQCGGSLIHPRVALTAAHCVAPKNQGDPQPKLKVRAGEWDTQTKNEVYPHQDRDVASIVTHNHFYAGGLFNDVALMFLERPFDPAENIGVICLPPEGPVSAPGTRCLASGWGKDVFGKEGKYQVILKKVELPIVANNQCQSALRKTRLGAEFQLHRSFMCAGGEPGKDTCKGDGGSALVCPIPGKPGRYMQTGIVAWGIGCGENKTPGVYANVPSVRKWIDDTLYTNDIDMTGLSADDIQDD